MGSRGHLVDRVGAGDRYGGGAGLMAHVRAGVGLHGEWKVEARRPFFNRQTGIWENRLIWVEEWGNIVVNQGLNHLLDVHFHAATQITTWYLALLGSSAGSPTATSTYQNFLSSGNNEVVAYDEAARQAFVEGAPSGQSIDNVGNEAVFTISANGTTIGGVALVSDSTKNDNGAGPFMYSAGAFSAGDKTIDDDDTLTVTVTLTAADDGA